MAQHLGQLGPYYSGKRCFVRLFISLFVLLFASIACFANDVSGNITGSTVIGIQNTPVSSTPPAASQILTYNGGSWVPANAAVTSVFGRGGAVVAGTGDYNFSQIAGTVSATQLPSILGDVTGTYGAVTVVKIQGVSVSATAPIANNVLTFDGTRWSPVAFSSLGPLPDVQLAPTGSQPTCSSSQKGRFWPIFAGTGSGDQLQYCAKGSDNVWSWRNVLGSL